MILTFAIIIMGFNYSSGLKNSYELSDKIILQTTNSIIKQTKIYIHKIDTSLKILVNNNLTNNIFDNENVNKDIMWRLVGSEKHIASIFLADDDKNFLQVRRDPRLAIRKIEIQDGKRVDTYEYKNSDNYTTDYSISKADYDPTSRPWYQFTNDSNIHVSKPYIFSSTKKQVSPYPMQILIPMETN